MMQDAWKRAFFSDRMPACSLRGTWVSFCLVDETGSGKPYGGLPFTIYDSAGAPYEGRLNGDGFAKLQGLYCGPAVLSLDNQYTGQEEPYRELMTRRTYQLPISELQFRAERTAFSNPDGKRIESNISRQNTDCFYQVEVSDLVRRECQIFCVRAGYGLPSGRPSLPGRPDKSISVQNRKLIHCVLPIMSCTAPVRGDIS